MKKVCKNKEKVTKRKYLCHNGYVFMFWDDDSQDILQPYCIHFIFIIINTFLPFRFSIKIKSRTFAPKIIKQTKIK